MGDPVRDQFGSQTAFLDAAAGGADQVIVAAVAGKRIYVDLITFTNGTAVCTAKLQSDTTQIGPVQAFAIGGNLVMQQPDLRTAIGQGLKVTTVGAGAVLGIFVRFHTEP
jgi:hypothetical protein